MYQACGYSVFTVSRWKWYNQIRSWDKKITKTDLVMDAILSQETWSNQSHFLSYSFYIHISAAPGVFIFKNQYPSEMWMFSWWRKKSSAFSEVSGVLNPDHLSWKTEKSQTGWREEADGTLTLHRACLPLCGSSDVISCSRAPPGPNAERCPSPQPLRHLWTSGSKSCLFLYSRHVMGCVFLSLTFLPLNLVSKESASGRNLVDSSFSISY